MILDDFIDKPFSKVILSNKKDKSFAYNKAVLCPIFLKGKNAWQLTLYTNKQAFQENLFTPKEVSDKIHKLFETNYKQFNFFGTDEDIEIKRSKKISS